MLKIKIKLSKKEKQNLLATKRNHKSNIIRDRAQAVLAVSEDLEIANIAKVLLRSDKFVKKAVKLYQKGKLSELSLKSNNNKLTKEQKAEITEMIKTKAPNELKGFNFKDQFWAADTLRAVIKRKCGIEYKTEKSYYDLFKAAGFSFHKPKTKDFRQDPAKMKEFKGALKKSSETTKIRLSW